ncbi:hypothetical protein FXO38_35599 [Capsicum annuum]|nr:hypothetical protein FXO38_35599 [Capsicum annuum]
MSIDGERFYWERNSDEKVFEKLGPSLYDFLRKNNYHSFSIDLVLMHDFHLIHTHMKPENILLTFPEYVKVPDYKVSSRSPKDGSYYKRIPKLSGIKVLDGPTLMIYGVLGVSLWKFVRFALNYIRDFDGGLKRDVVSTLKKLLIGNLVYGPLINSAFFSFNAGLQEFQDSQSKSLPTFLEVQYCNDTFSCSSSSSEVKSSPLFDRPPDKKFHIYGNSQLGSWVLPLFEDYNDNMDVPDENINEDAPLSYREYENFCFVRKQLLQIENQQST